MIINTFTNKKTAFDAVQQELFHLKDSKNRSSKNSMLDSVFREIEIEKTMNEKDYKKVLRELEKALNDIIQDYQRLYGKIEVAYHLLNSTTKTVSYSEAPIAKDIAKVKGYGRNLSKEELRLAIHTVESLYDAKLTNPAIPVEKIGYILVDILDKEKFVLSKRGVGSQTISDMLFCQYKKSKIDGLIPPDRLPCFSLTVLYIILGILIYHGIIPRNYSSIIRAFESQIPYGERGIKYIDNQAKKLQGIAKIKNNVAYLDIDANYYLSKAMIEYISETCIKHSSKNSIVC